MPVLRGEGVNIRGVCSDPLLIPCGILCNIGGFERGTLDPLCNLAKIGIFGTRWDPLCSFRYPLLNAPEGKVVTTLNEIP